MNVYIYIIRCHSKKNNSVYLFCFKYYIFYKLLKNDICLTEYILIYIYV